MAALSQHQKWNVFLFELFYTAKVKEICCVCVSQRQMDKNYADRQRERERERESDVLLTPSVCIAGRLLCLTEYTLKNNCIGNLNSLK